MSRTCEAARASHPGQRCTIRLPAALATAALVLGLGAPLAPVPVAGQAGVAPTQRAATVRIEVVSNRRADLVSGGDALVAITAPRVDRASQLRVALNGRRTTTRFVKQAPHRFVGLVTGLRLGDNALTATVRGQAGGARLRIVNHPNGGPVFSGRPQQPYTCQATAVDRTCNQPVTYSYRYLPVGQDQLRPYDRRNPPADVATTTTSTGATVPFVVRREFGYQDRNQYQVLVLFDPAKPWTASHRQRGWNQKLVVLHGSACGAAYAPTGAPLTDANGDGQVGRALYVHALSKGFAVLSTALANARRNCNISLQAESVMMAKERITEQYGEIRYTIGSGCSGGSLTPLQVSNAYPGLYDGLAVNCSFPDFWSGTTIGWVTDQTLLHLYFSGTGEQTPRALWTPGQVQAVLGQPFVDNALTYALYNQLINFFDPTVTCPGIDETRVYDPVRRPGGVRCTPQDWAPTVLGRRRPASWTPQEKRAGHGFVGLPIGNVGVQYGLAALNAGTITPTQFVDVNRRVGSFDIDYHQTRARTQADPTALANAYRTGSINDATRLNRIPIIVGSPPNDALSENHPGHNAYILRERIRQASGSARNLVIWEGQKPITTDIAFYLESFDAIDRWLARIERDPRALTTARKVTANKPADVQDSCWDGIGHVLNTGRCAIAQRYQPSRTIAGGPLTSDVNACRLKAMRRSAYRVAFTDAQWTQLRAAFPDGVCDWSRTGMHQAPSRPWLTYSTRSGGTVVGGRPMPTAPVSTPVGR